MTEFEGKLPAQLPASRMSNEEALVIWITALQTAHLYHDLPSIRVLGYDGDDQEYTEIDLLTDDATNFIDDTWTQAVYYPADLEQKEEEETQ